MQMLVLSGSRNRAGRTAQAIKALENGFERGGGAWDSLFLSELKLERCRQCENDGWGICRSEGKCIIEDDFPTVEGKIRSADVVVFATPVYFADLSESMRGFLDRLRRIRFRRVPTGAPGALGIPGTPGVAPTRGTPAVGFCLSGGGGGGAPNCCMNLDRILQTCGFDVVDMILARRQNFEMKLPILELTGEWLATKLSSVVTTPARLER
ncbi:MAG: flavodoxin family protein [Chloroflexi bacterium]|nr:flavodoxin family protein [Chloroflexota bacterium]